MEEGEASWSGHRERLQQRVNGSSRQRWKEELSDEGARMCQSTQVKKSIDVPSLGRFRGWELRSQ